MKFISFRFLLLFVLLCSIQSATAQFVHPGGLLNQTDLDRIKEKVLTKQSPWIDGWNLLLKDFKAQKTYNAKPSPNISGENGNRQQAVKDADAAFFNALIWYVTGDEEHAECAVRILNAWANTVQSEVSGELYQLAIPHMVQAAELLRVYPGWSSEDFDKFKYMCRNYFYPPCKKFIGKCGSWTGWDGPANASILMIGVLCDDQALFDEAVEYYKSGNGGGSIMNAVCQPTGQLAEMGRDQPHANIGPAYLADMCQFAWNQGVDLFGYADNRLLKGFEYFCKFNLNEPVEWVPFNDCVNNNFYYLAYRHHNRVYNKAVFELVYNHYVEIKGLEAPYTRAMIKLNGLNLSYDDNLGWCALTYNLSDTTTLFVPHPKPSAPTNLAASSGIDGVHLSWTGQSGHVVKGHEIYRSRTIDGVYTKVGEWTNNTMTEYYDNTALINGGTYYYKVSTNNQSGSSNFSNIASVTTSKPLSEFNYGWQSVDIGSVTTQGRVRYADVNNNSYLVRASGTNAGGDADALNFTYTQITGDFSISGRIYDFTPPGEWLPKIGIMVRESLDVNAKFASMMIADSQTRYTWFSVRQVTGGRASWTKGNTHTWVPVWFKLERINNMFIGYQSVDGETWFEVGRSTVGISDSCYVGLFSTGGSPNAGEITTTVFDNISVTGKSAGIDSDTSKSRFGIYPNPTSDILYLDINETVNVDVFSASGAKVLSQRVSVSENAINVRALVSGLYFIQINNGKNICSVKFIKD